MPACVLDNVDLATNINNENSYSPAAYLLIVDTDLDQMSTIIVV